MCLNVLVIYFYFIEKCVMHLVITATLGKADRCYIFR